MSQTGAATSGVVEASVLIEASPRTVFSILTDPQRFSTWMNGRAAFEARPGSPFSIDFPKFQTRIEGEVLEVEPDRRIVVSWGVAEGRQEEWLPAGSTRVAFELEPEGEGTRVKLVHSGLPTEQEVQQHGAGWRFHLSRLSLGANRDQLAESLPESMAAWFAAWGEPDSQARMPLLERCCAADLEYADEHATLTGLEKLSLHIGNTQQYLPGFRLTADGNVSVCRGEALIPWRIEDQDGETVFTGTNHARVSPDGTIRRLVGFWKGGRAG